MAATKTRDLIYSRAVPYPIGPTPEPGCPKAAKVPRLSEELWKCRASTLRLPGSGHFLAMTRQQN